MSSIRSLGEDMLPFPEEANTNYLAEVEGWVKRTATGIRPHYVTIGQIPRVAAFSAPAPQDVTLAF